MFCDVGLATDACRMRENLVNSFFSAFGRGGWVRVAPESSNISFGKFGKWGEQVAPESSEINYTEFNELASCWMLVCG